MKKDTLILIVGIFVATALIYLAVDTVSLMKFVLVTCGELLLVMSGINAFYNSIKDELEEEEEESNPLRQVDAIIEQANDGNYSVFMDADDMSYLVTGTGKSVKEAINTFKENYEGIKRWYTKYNKEFEEVEFNYVISEDLI